MARPITPWTQACWAWLSVVKWRERQLISTFQFCGLQDRIVQVDSHTSMAFWCEPQEQEAIQKPALLLIHGFGGSSTWQWEKQVKPLHKCFRLFLPDLVFFGKSSTKSHLRSETFQAEMIALAMEAMGVSTYYVVGISYGGFVAFRLAHMFPDRVEKVVIVSSPMCITPRDVQELLERAHVDNASDLFLPQSPAILRTLLQLSFLKSFPFLPTFVCNDVIQNLYAENREERKELLESLQIGRQDGPQVLPILPQKVLIVWGDKDGIFPLELGYRLKEHLKENAEVAVIKNAAHAVQLENPPEFNHLILGFFLEGAGTGTSY
ncbi:hypothetical protein L7F22_000916 [Adiantum nelumboides]|nr:hypothetical protein [Adiantum nelumboides]